VCLDGVKTWPQRNIALEPNMDDLETRLCHDARRVRGDALQE
jgi:hypothetical protein